MQLHTTPTKVFLWTISSVRSPARPSAYPPARPLGNSNFPHHLSTPAENGDNGEDVSSSPPAPDVSPPKDEAAAPAIQLWDPVGEPSEIIGHGKTITEAGNRGDGPAGEGDGKCHAAPLFESIFIFGGIDGAAISGVSGASRITCLCLHYRIAYKIPYNERAILPASVAVGSSKSITF